MFPFLIIISIFYIIVNHDTCFRVIFIPFFIVLPSIYTFLYNAVGFCRPLDFIKSNYTVCILLWLTLCYQHLKNSSMLLNVCFLCCTVFYYISQRSPEKKNQWVCVCVCVSSCPRAHNHSYCLGYYPGFLGHRVWFIQLYSII